MQKAVCQTRKREPLDAYRKPTGSPQEAHRKAINMRRVEHQDLTPTGIPITEPIAVDCAVLEDDAIPTDAEIDIEPLQEGLPDRAFMRKRYRVVNKTINVWCDALEIWRPGREGSFSQDDVDLLDDLWIAMKVFRLTLTEFVNWIFIPAEIQVPYTAEKELKNAAKLDRFIYQKHRVFIEARLATDENFNYRRIVVDKLERIKKLKKQLATTENQPKSNQ